MVDIYLTVSSYFEGEKPLLPHPSEALDLSGDNEGDVECEKDPLVDLIVEAKKDGVFATNKKVKRGCSKVDACGMIILSWSSFHMNEIWRILKRIFCICTGRQL